MTERQTGIALLIAAVVFVLLGLGLAFTIFGVIALLLGVGAVEGHPWRLTVFSSPEGGLGVHSAATGQSGSIQGAWLWAPGDHCGTSVTCTAVRADVTTSIRAVHP